MRVANTETKAFMKRIGANANKNDPSSGTLELHNNGDISWFIKGKRHTMKSKNVPKGVGDTIPIKETRSQMLKRLLNVK